LIPEVHEFRDVPLARRGRIIIQERDSETGFLQH
jgi:hypothetical protein